MIGKRSDYISWDEYFMGIAQLSALRSKDPHTQVGACIVSNKNRILGVGYNGLPQGCSDDEFPWDRTADNEEETKYPYVCHAELNAILNSDLAAVPGSTLYVSLFPCNECAKAIIQAGIRKIVYISDKYDGTPENNASKRLLDAAGVKYSKLVTTRENLILDF